MNFSGTYDFNDRYTLDEARPGLFDPGSDCFFFFFLCPVVLVSYTYQEHCAGWDLAVLPLMRTLTLDSLNTLDGTFKRYLCRVVTFVFVF